MKAENRTLGRSVVLSDSDIEASNKTLAGLEYPHDAVHDMMTISYPGVRYCHFKAVFERNGIMGAQYPFRVMYEDAFGYTLYETVPVPTEGPDVSDAPDNSVKQHTLELAIIEAQRFIKAAKHCRAMMQAGEETPRQLANIKRKALDLRYALADVRAGR